MREKTHFGAFMVLVLTALFYSPAFAGQFDLGLQYQGWNSNYASPFVFGGSEIWAPISLNVNLGPAFNFYASGEFGYAGYTDSLSGSPNTLYLTGFSDTVVGGELNFKFGSMPSLLDIAFNLPTGNPAWETQQIASDIPTQFIDSRYRGRGFGVSALYGLSFPMGDGELGAAAGYLYSGAFNPNTGATGGSLKLGDSVFLSLNQTQPFPDHQSQIIRLSGFYFLSSQQNNSDLFQMGPNVNASYSWNNPSAFSFEVGGQYYFLCQRANSGGQLTTEPSPSYGPRVYFNPSYAFGDFTVAGQVKYVFPNGYAIGDPLYATCVGGWLWGLEPSLKLKLDSGSALSFSASYDFVDAENAAIDINNNPTNVLYNHWSFGTNYEVKL